MNNIIAKAKKAKEMGYTYMASVVKTHYDTTYYNVVPVSMVIREGRWIPARHCIFPSGAHGRDGITGAQVDWNITVKRTDI